MIRAYIEDQIAEGILFKKQGRHMVEPGGRDCIFRRCAKQLRILCPSAIQTSVISLLNAEVGVSVDQLDKASGILSKPLWSTALSFLWSVAFIIQTINLCFQRSVFPCLLYCFLVVCF